MFNFWSSCSFRWQFLQYVQDTIDAASQRNLSEILVEGGWHYLALAQRWYRLFSFRQVGHFQTPQKDEGLFYAPIFLLERNWFLIWTMFILGMYTIIICDTVNPQIPCHFSFPRIIFYCLYFSKSFFSFRKTPD